MTMNGVFAMSAVTALTAQNTTGVRSVMEATPAFLADELDAVEGVGPALRFALQDPKLYKSDLEGFRVIVCDEYLQSRKVLKITDDFNKPMPQDIVKKMEKK